MDIKKITTTVFGVEQSEQFVVDCFDKSIQKIMDFLAKIEIRGSKYSEITFEVDGKDNPDECLKKGNTFYGAFKAIEESEKKMTEKKKPETKIICRIPIMTGSKYIPKDMEYKTFRGMFIVVGELYVHINWELQQRNEVITTFKDVYKTSLTCYNYKTHVSCVMKVTKGTSKEEKDVLMIDIGKKNMIEKSKTSVNLFSYIMFCEVILKIWEKFPDKIKNKKELKGRNVFTAMTKYLKIDENTMFEKIVTKIFKYIPKNDKTDYYLMTTLEDYKNRKDEENYEDVIKTFGYLYNYSSRITTLDAISPDEYRSFFEFMHEKVLESYFPQLDIKDKNSRYLLFADIIYQNSCNVLKDIDSLMYKTFESAGFSVERVFIKSIINAMNKITKKRYVYSNAKSVIEAVETIFINNFKSGVSTTIKSKTKNASRPGISQRVESTDYKSTYNLAKIGASSKTDVVTKGVAGRLYGNDHMPYIDGANVPEGEKCGRTKQFTIATKLSTDGDVEDIKMFAKTKTDTKAPHKLLINNEYIGKVEISFVKEFKEKRRSGAISKEASIFIETGGFKRIIIKTYPNRPLFPFYVLDEEGFPIVASATGKFRFFDLLNKGFVEYLDPSELSNVEKYGTDPDTLYEDMEYCIMHPAHMLSKAINVNSFLTQHDPPQRITFLIAMMKAQAVRHKDSSSRLFQTDIAYKEHGQKPVIQNMFSSFLDFTGEIALTATISFLKTTEDGIIISRSFAERNGLIFYENYDISVKRVPFGINKIMEEKNLGSLEDKYANEGLSSEGVIKVGQKVYKGKVIALNVSTEIKDGVTHIIFEKEQFKDEKEGVVTKIVKAKDTTELNYIIQVQRINDSAEVGNKFTTGHGQKGTISEVVEDKDMLRDVKTGRIIDVINGPPGISNRLTIAQLHEQKIAFAFPIGLTRPLSEFIKRYKDLDEDFYIPLVHVQPNGKDVIDFLNKWGFETPDIFGEIKKTHILHFDEMDGDAKYVLYSELSELQKFLLEGKPYKDLILHDAYVKRTNMNEFLTKFKQVSFEDTDEVLIEAEKKLKEMGYENGATLYNPRTDSDLKNILVGNVYYYPLKQTAKGKAHFSNVANINPLTGDNNKGRKRHGGLTVGYEEMAMWRLFGLDKFIAEKRQLSGVLIPLAFCSTCGMKASLRNDKYFCINCTKSQKCCDEDPILKDSEITCKKCDTVSFVLPEVALAFVSVIDYFKASGISLGISI